MHVDSAGASTGSGFQDRELLRAEGVVFLAQFRDSLGENSNSTYSIGRSGMT